MLAGECDEDRLTGDRTCVPPYNLYKDKEGHYCPGWVNYDASLTSCDNPYLYTQTAWKYINAKEIWGSAIAGHMSMYSGGGYLLKLENGLENSRNILNELMKYHWINRETRAVFIEFTLYNANVNLFTYSVFLAEFPESGGMIPWWNVQSFRAYQHVGVLGAYAMICYAVYLIFVLIDAITIIRKIQKLGRSFVYSLWNLVDFTCIVLSFVGMAFWIMRYLKAKEAVSFYVDDKDAFINFQHVVTWDTLFNILQSLIVFVSTVRILKILGYNDRMNQLSLVIAGAGKDLLGFGVIFGAVYIAYISLGYLLFGSTLKEYRSIYATFGSLSNTIIGRNSLDTMIKSAPAFAQFYFFTYVVVVIMTLMTISAAILNQSIWEVKAKLNAKPEMFGIVDYVTKTIKGLLGIVNIEQKRNTPGGGHNMAGTYTCLYMSRCNIADRMSTYFRIIPEHVCMSTHV